MEPTDSIAYAFFSKYTNGDGVFGSTIANFLQQCSGVAYDELAQYAADPARERNATYDMPCPAVLEALGGSMGHLMETPKEYLQTLIRTLHTPTIGYMPDMDPWVDAVAAEYAHTGVWESNPRLHAEDRFYKALESLIHRITGPVRVSPADACALFKHEMRHR
jgi:hypothetical protein